MTQLDPVMNKRYFGVSEANRHVDELNQLFGAVMQLRAQLKTLYQRLSDAGHAPGKDDDEQIPEELSRDRAVFEGMAQALKEQVRAIMATGCVIKDIEIGLVDWPALHEGREIWLCWKYGEDAVRFWHDHHTGFNGRRPVSELSD